MEIKPIFFDESGRRRKIVNILLAALLFFFVLGIAYLYFFVNQANRIESSIVDRGPTKRRAASNTALLYTDSGPNATGVISDRAEVVDTVFMPRYKIETEGVNIPTSYDGWYSDFKRLIENRPVHNKTYAILSPYDFVSPPTERRLPVPAGARARPGVTGIDVANMLKIRDDLIKNGFNGVYAELDIASLESREQVELVTEWVKDFTAIIESSGLDIGVIADVSSLTNLNIPIITAQKALYLQFSSTDSYQSQIDILVKHKNKLPKDTIFEVPTVSSSLDTTVYKGYRASVDYRKASSSLSAESTKSRLVEPINIVRPNSILTLIDSISAYNLVQSLKLSKVLENIDYSFAISDPGFEEFSTWHLLEDPFNYDRSYTLLSDEYRPALGIDISGSGEIYTISGVGTLGKRSIKFDDQYKIASSSIITEDKSVQIKKAGHKDKRIALTFDDGPHPVYTQKVLDILDKYGIKGTFFNVGQNVLKYPAVAKETVARGHEIENHSYTHPVFSKLQEETQLEEIKATNLAIFKLTGQQPQYFRKPYSNQMDIDTDASVKFLKDLDTLGLSLSEYDIDSKDWLLDNSEEVVRRVKQEIDDSNGNYSQILLHDFQEDAEITLVALPQIIEYLQSKGIQIVRVDQLNDETISEPITTFSTSNVYRALEGSQISLNVLGTVSYIILMLALVRNAWIVLGSAIHSFRAKFGRYFLKKLNKKHRKYPNMAVIVSCYNEEMVIGRTIQSLLDCKYPGLKITIVNDGSKDKTVEIVKEFCVKNKNVRLINLPNGGKAKALQKAIKSVRTQWLVFCDADTMFEKNALHTFADSLFMTKDTGAVAGEVQVGNDINMLTRAQAIEYGIAHSFIKPSQDVLNIVTVVPGAVGMWDRKSLVANGGFTHDTLAEDADATLKMVSSGKKVIFNGDVIAVTEAPEKIGMLYKQRTRWQLGNLQSVYKHRGGLLNKKYGALGFIGLPFFYVDIFAALSYPFLLLFSLYIIVAQFMGIEIVTVSQPFLLKRELSVILGVTFAGLELAMAFIVIITQKRGIVSKIKMLATLPYYMTFYKAFLSYATIVSFTRALRGTMEGWSHLKRTGTAIQKS